MILEIRIKNILDYIIDVAYRDCSPEQLKRFKGYYIQILPKELKTSGGRYYCNERRIEVYNPSLGEKHLAKCCIHELSHHIDYMLNGAAGHQRSFYEVYTKLIYASLDAGVLTEEDFDDHWSSDQNKVREIVKRYIPHPVERKTESDILFKVYNAYTLKDQLKEHGYSWNKMEQTWERKVSVDDSQQERKLLQNIGISEGEQRESKTPYYTVISPQQMYIDAILYIKAVGCTFENKDVLKEHGFYFTHENRIWIKKIRAGQKDEFLQSLKKDNRLNDIRFTLVSKR